MTLTGSPALTSKTLPSRNDGLTTLTRSSLTASRGQTVSLTITGAGLTNGDTYRFTLMGTKKTTPNALESMTALTGISVSAGDTISIAADAANSWVAVTTAGTNSYSGKIVDWTNSPYSWGTGPTSKTFNIAVSGSAPFDVYSLTARFLGDDGTVHFGLSEEIFLNVVPEPSTMTLLLMAGAGLTCVVWRRRRSRTQAA
jgi:hypothetical protein